MDGLMVHRSLLEFAADWCNPRQRLRKYRENESRCPPNGVRRQNAVVAPEGGDSAHVAQCPSASRAPDSRPAEPRVAGCPGEGGITRMQANRKTFEKIPDGGRWMVNPSHCHGTITTL